MLELTNDLRQPLSQRGPLAFVPLYPVIQALALRVPFPKTCFHLSLGLPDPLIMLDETLHLEFKLFEFVKVHETTTEQILNG